MIVLSAATLTLWITSLQQGSIRDQLVVIAVVNAAVWVGLFLFLLWLFNRRSKNVEERLARLESSMPGDDESAKQ